MSSELTTTGDKPRISSAVMEQVLIGGNLAELTPAQRVEYYVGVCRSLGLNELTQPFAYIVLNDKLTLYAKRDATDQIRRNQQITVAIIGREIVDQIYVVTARATTPDGRSDESIGAVPLVKESGTWKTNPDTKKRFFDKDGQTTPLAPDERANAIMKAETKAKRRVTLSIAGLGWADETEVETIPGAKRVVVAETGEIVSPTENHAQLKAPLPEPPEEPLFDNAAADNAIERADILNQIAKDKGVAKLSDDQLHKIAIRDYGVRAFYWEAKTDQLQELAAKVQLEKVKKENER